MRIKCLQTKGGAKEEGEWKWRAESGRKGGAKRRGTVEAAFREREETLKTNRGRKARVILLGARSPSGARPT